jgi:hypothetical protein
MPASACGKVQSEITGCIGDKILQVDRAPQSFVELILWLQWCGARIIDIIKTFSCLRISPIG